ncbi:response regulator transcription factor [Terriglobus sp. TAA 43]|uniref:response regulator transcription factor n=1 Tax=Terriglobus sp. TAA 43 TaxID=278961 RepID=UPI00068DE535|nr:LuxR C-terminal-related transcriptional regulator [Terriglobus sp. TAA 43]
MTTSIPYQTRTVPETDQDGWARGRLKDTHLGIGINSAMHRTSMLRDTAKVAYVITDNDDLVDHISELLDQHRILTKFFRSASNYLAYQRPPVTSCVLINRSLSDLSGMDLESMLKTTSPPIVFLSNSREIPDCVQAIKKGAQDFLTMPLDSLRLLDALEGAFQKDKFSRIVRLEQEALLNRWRSLSRREAEVVRYAVRGFLNKQTAAEMNIAENTVQVHRGRAMQKMSAASFADLVRMTLKLDAYGETSFVYSDTG